RKADVIFFGPGRVAIAPDPERDAAVRPLGKPQRSPPELVFGFRLQVGFVIVEVDDLNVPAEQLSGGGIVTTTSSGRSSAGYIRNRNSGFGVCGPAGPLSLSRIRRRLRRADRPRAGRLHWPQLRDRNLVGVGRVPPQRRARPTYDAFGVGRYADCRPGRPPGHVDGLAVPGFFTPPFGNSRIGRCRIWSVNLG